MARVISSGLGQAQGGNVGTAIAQANPFSAIWNTVTGTSQGGIAAGASVFNNALNANAASSAALYASVQPRMSYMPYVAAGLGVLALGVLAIAATRK